MELRKLEHPEQIDFVYAHNDMMAIAAREYFMAWDSIRGRELRIIGVDAVAGAGLEAVEDGRINASFLYPTGGGASDSHGYAYHSRGSRWISLSLFVRLR